MLASELLGSKWLDEHKDIDITGIAYDSRNVLPGNVFVCIKGFETDGHKYAEMAVKNGASLIVAEDKIDVDVPVWYVENSRVEIAEMACKYYGNPSSKFKLIGITGTNGKTTITYLIKSIIETAGMRIGVIGTNQNIIGDKVLVTQSTTPTTPNALELQQLFAEMVDSDAECVVMEVSSHALELERVHGCHFDVGVFTNLTRDHLDFHKTMENYLNAKAKLFKISDKGVVNFDDDGGKKIVANNDCDILKVGLSDGCDLKAKNIEISSSGADFDVEYDGKTYRVHIVIPGKFSVYNAICAMGAALQMGIDMDTIIKGLGMDNGVNCHTDISRIVNDNRRISSANAQLFADVILVIASLVSSREGTSIHPMIPSGAPALTAASSTTLAASMVLFFALGCGEMMMALRVFKEISVLKIAVEVGFVVGITAAIRPIGSAIFFIPYSLSSSTTPTVFVFLYAL